MIFPRTREEYTAWALETQGRYPEYMRELKANCTHRQELEINRATRNFIRTTHHDFSDLLVLVTHTHPVTELTAYIICIAGVNMGLIVQQDYYELVHEHD